MIHFFENQALGFFIGYLLGFFSAAWIIQMVRCENCCQQDDDDPTYWLDKLGRRKEDKL